MSYNRVGRERSALFLWVGDKVLRKSDIKAEIKKFLKKTEKRLKRFILAPCKANCGRVPTTELVNIVFNFCELYSGRTFYPYQEQFSKRIIRSVLENDGEELTALFARQSGKTETNATTVGGMMIILPQLANMPMFADDKRLQMFKDGLWVGIFAPSLRQAQTAYGRLKSRLQCKNAMAILEDPEFRLEFSTSNGQTVALTNGSFATAISASDGANIEGESFKLIICEEAQDISNFKVRKCLTGDTKVLLEDGTYKRIDEIVEDKKDKIVCYDNNMDYLVSHIPTEFYDNGVQDVYEITLDNGSTIKATDNHQFYTYNQKTKGDKCSFRTVKQIRESMSNDRPLRIGVPDRLPYFAKGSRVDYFDGLILGYFLGDGCAVGTPKFIGDIPTCDRLISLIKEFVDYNVNMTETAYNCDNGMQEVCFSTPTNCKGSNTMLDFLTEYGLYNKTGSDKKLLDKLYSKDFYKGIVEALIETDGCVECCTTKPIISFANISKDLVYQLKDILLRFGIHSTVFVRDNKNGFWGDNAKPLWLLHIKSVRDIRRFADEFVLFRKQASLDEAICTIADKEDRECSKYYSNEMRFCCVKSIKYVGKEPTYCLKVEGRNFIANGMISSNSIHPMGAAYNATIVKIGTATTFKGNFYEAIHRNKANQESRKSHIKNHFEYDWNIAAKYNPNYAKYVEKEKKRIGEKSDEFRMSYCLEWIIERGMFVDITKFEQDNTEPLLERSFYDKSANHVAGIDLGGKGDDTIITVVEVNWDMPVSVDSFINENGEEETYTTFNTYLKDWCCISNEPDYEEQYPLIVDYLNHFLLARVVCDATREASISHRLRANLKCEVIPFIFTTKSKSEVYKHLDKEIVSGRARICAGPNTVETREYKDFIQQLGELQKGWSGTHMVVSHPTDKDHDDYPDSWALAVWGTSFKGEVNNTETVTNKFTAKSNSQIKGVRTRNRITAKRR